MEDTPKREQELFSIQRDYQNLKELYDSLQKRKLEADIAVSMEKKQKGEQFRIIDPAKVARTALQNAASIAGMLITTECLITDLPEKNPAPPMPDEDMY